MHRASVNRTGVQRASVQRTSAPNERAPNERASNGRASSERAAIALEFAALLWGTRAVCTPLTQFLCQLGGFLGVLVGWSVAVNWLTWGVNWLISVS